MKTKIKIIAGIVATSLLAGCFDHETYQDARISGKCVAGYLICSVKLVSSTVNKSTNLLGITKETVVSESPLSYESLDITWSSPNGTIADSDKMTLVGLDGCEDGVCTENSNPTGFQYSEAEPQQVLVQGEMMLKNKVMMAINQIYMLYPQDFYTEATYYIPTLSTKSASEIVSTLSIDYSSVHVASVVAVGSNQLKFTCKPGFHILESMADMGNGQAQQAGDYGSIAYRTQENGSENWVISDIYTAANNIGNQSSYYTGMGCMPDVPATSPD